MYRLRPLHISISILTFAMGIGVAIYLERSWGPDSAISVTVPSEQSGFKSEFYPREFKGDVYVEYTRSYDWSDDVASPTGEACFVLTNRTEVSVFYSGGFKDDYEGASTLIDGDERIHTTRDASVQELKPGESIRPCIEAARSYGPMIARFPMKAGRVSGEVTVDVESQHFHKNEPLN